MTLENLLPILLPLLLPLLCNIAHTVALMMHKPRVAAWIEVNTPTIDRFLLRVLTPGPKALPPGVVVALADIDLVAKDHATVARANALLRAGLKSLGYLSTLAYMAAIVLACFLSLGCASPMRTAVVVANGLSDVGQVASSALETTCVAAYREAKTPADIAAIDKPCMPASKAYAVLRAAHAALVATIVAVQAGADMSTLLPAIQQAEEAAATLGAVMKEVAK